MPLENEPQIQKIHLHPSHIDPDWHEENNKIIEDKLNEVIDIVNAILEFNLILAKTIKESQGENHGNTETRQDDK